MQLVFGQPSVNLKSNILEVVVPKELEVNIPTGLPQVDILFAGDGVMPSTSALVTGQPGLGKSTMMLQLADSLTGQGHKVLYVAGEESLYQIRKRIRSLELKHGFIPSYDTGVMQVIANAKSLQKTAKKDQRVFVIVDSLQCLVLDEDNDTKSTKAKRGRPKKVDPTTRCIELLTMWAKESFGVALMIGHVTKSGDFAGKNSLRHTLDCHLHFEVDTERRSETYQQRIAIMKKNRTGISEQYFPYEIGRTGLHFNLVAVASDSEE